MRQIPPCSPKLYKVNMIAGRWNGDLHAGIVGGHRRYARVNMKRRSPCVRSRWSSMMKRRSPCVRSRWSPKVCKGQHDRRLMKRRSVNMIADRRSDVLHICVVGGCWSYTRSTWSSVDETTISMCVVGGRRKYAKINMIAGCWSGVLHRSTWSPIDEAASTICVIGGRRCWLFFWVGFSHFKVVLLQP